MKCVCAFLYLASFPDLWDEDGAKLVVMVIEAKARMPDLPWIGRRITRRHPSLPGAARLRLSPCWGDRRSARVRQTWESRAHVEGESADLNRLGQEDVDRI